MCYRTYWLFPCAHPHLRDWEQCYSAISSDGLQCFSSTVIVEYPTHTPELDEHKRCRECRHCENEAMGRPRSISTAKLGLRMERRRRRLIVDGLAINQLPIAEDYSPTVAESSAMAHALEERTWRTFEKQPQRITSNQCHPSDDDSLELHVAPSMSESNDTGSSTESLPASNAELLCDLEGFIIDRICVIEERKNSLAPGCLADRIKYAFNLEILESGIPSSVLMEQKEIPVEVSQIPSYAEYQVPVELEYAPHNTAIPLTQKEPSLLALEDYGSGVDGIMLAASLPQEKHTTPTVSAPVTVPLDDPSAVEVWEDISITPARTVVSPTRDAERVGALSEESPTITQDSSGILEARPIHFQNGRGKVNVVNNMDQPKRREKKWKARTQRILDKLTLRTVSGDKTAKNTVYSIERTPPNKDLRQKENRKEKRTVLTEISNPSAERIPITIRSVRPKLGGTGTESPGQSPREASPLNVEVHSYDQTPPRQSHPTKERSGDIFARPPSERTNHSDTAKADKNTWRGSIQKFRGLARSASRLRLFDPASNDSDDVNSTNPYETGSSKGLRNADDGSKSRGSTGSSDSPHLSPLGASLSPLSIQVSPLSKYDLHAARKHHRCVSDAIPDVLPSDMIQSYQGHSDDCGCPSLSDICLLLPPLPPSSSSDGDLPRNDVGHERRETSWGRRTERALGAAAGSVVRPSSTEPTQNADRDKLFVNQRRTVGRVASENMLTSTHTMTDSSISRQAASKSVDNLSLLVGDGHAAAASARGNQTTGQRIIAHQEQRFLPSDANMHGVTSISASIEQGASSNFHGNKSIISAMPREISHPCARPGSKRTRHDTNAIRSGPYGWNRYDRSLIPHHEGQIREGKYIQPRMSKSDGYESGDEALSIGARWINSRNF